jgi:hypothetical protein
VRDAIRSDTAVRWVFEVDAVGARTLEPATIATITDALGVLVDKPDGIDFVPGEPIEGSLLWNEAALRALGDATFDDDGPADTLTSHVLLLDGQYIDGDRLGVSWDQTHIALFTNTIDRICTEGPGDPDRICPAMEEGVLLHEIGHLLGLVNAGLPMVSDHEDPEHPAHDHNADCIMYWSYDREGLAQQVQDRGQGQEKLAFDDACVADIEAVRIP